MERYQTAVPAAIAAGRYQWEPVRKWIENFICGTVDPISLFIQTTYNAAGWIQDTTDPKGIVAQTSYDLLGRATQTIADYTDGTPTDSSNQTTSYIYDSDNNVTIMTANMPGGETSQVTHYVYGVTIGQGSDIDDNDLLYQVQYPDPTSGTNTSGGTYNQAETYTYDALGEQLTYEDRNLTTHTYAYDQLGRLTSDSVSAGSGVDSTVAKLGCAYNDAGDMSKTTSYNSGGGSLNQVVETYDGFGQLSSDAQSNAGNVSSGTPTVGYSYDAGNDDRLTGIAYPGGRVVSYNYNAGLDSILSRVSSVSDEGGSLQSYTYLGWDTPVTFTDGNGVSLSYLGTIGSTGGDAGDQYTGLDRFGRVINQNWSTSTGAGVDQFKYGYDADSNVTYKQAVTNTSSGTVNTRLAGQSQLFTYDSLNRLTNYSTGTLTISGGTASISGSPSGTQGWSLDALGNWHSNTVNGTTTNRNNSGQNQVSSVGSATLIYDKNGNTTTDQTGQQYVYDAWNRVVKVKNSFGTTIATYSYDALGRRIAQTESSTTTDMYYTSNDQVIEDQQGGNETEEYVWSPFYVDSLIERDDAAGLDTPTSDPNFHYNTSSPTVIAPSGDTIGIPTAGEPMTAVYTQGSYEGDIVVVVNVWGSSSGGTIARYNANGTLDSSFGTGGKVFESGWQVTTVAVQSDGKVLVGVITSSGGTEVARLKADGTVDTSFGSSGIATVAGSIDNEGTTSVIVVESNGDILVGASGASNYYGYWITISRLTASGSTDSTFGTDGTTGDGAGVAGTTSVYVDNFAGVTSADIIAATGQIVVSGFAPGTGIFVFRVSSTGVMDSSFGFVYFYETLIPPGGDLGPLMAVQSNGGIIINYETESGDPAILRLNPDGTLDEDFGVDYTIADTDYITGLAIESNGDILVLDGYSETAYVLAPDGNSLVTSFSSDAASVMSTSMGMVLEPDNRLLTVGIGSSGTTVILEEYDLSQRLYVEQDANYNVTSLTNSSGGVVERYSYNPYGNVTVLNADGTTEGGGTAASSSVGWVYLHQGLQLDVVTGMYDDRNRVYSASLGRFLQEDPSRYIDGQNLYQLEVSNPMHYVDPTGESTLGTIFATVAGIATGLCGAPSGPADVVIIGVTVGVATELGDKISDDLWPNNPGPVQTAPTTTTTTTTTKTTQTSSGTTVTLPPGSVITLPGGGSAVVGPGGAPMSTGPVTTTTVTTVTTTTTNGSTSPQTSTSQTSTTNSQDIGMWGFLKMCGKGIGNIWDHGDVSDQPYGPMR